MTIGSLGNVPFKVTKKTVQTFTNMSWSTKANYSTHKLHMKTGMLELTGFDPDEISFDMFLSAFMGVKPMKVLKKLQQMLVKGKVCTLVLGTDVIGKKWVITEISRSFKHVYKDGALVSCEVTITLKQYE